MKPTQTVAIWTGIGVILYFLVWIWAWLTLSLKVAAPWLTELGLVEWASVVLSLSLIGFACFWLGLLLFMLVTALLAVFVE